MNVQRLAEQRGEEERHEVVDLEGQLVPVAGDGACSGGDQPGVVDRDADPRAPGCQLPGELPNLREVSRRGRVYVSNASVRGAFVLRACIVNHRTTDADIAAVVDEVLAAAAATT